MEHSLDADTLRHLTDEYLARCFAKPAPPTVSQLAAELAMPGWQLARAFYRELRVTPATYLRNAQIERAQRLLRLTASSVDEVCFAAAFATRMTFFRAFHRATGMTPAQYRRSICK